ncbi:MAG TPA: flagellar hook-basal body complex protein [Tepidisphaeraceae bacterium]|nr:flagellar hook-basal body complex protein [Tepidisphaeraceae bacterium]
MSAVVTAWPICGANGQLTNATFALGDAGIALPSRLERRPMALTSTLFTGLSGLEVNQTRLNVVGNNIANVNTIAFKSSRALFTPQFYVTDGSGSPPSADFGGENPSQRGLGAQVATIQKNFAAGTLETTGRPTDLAIDGGGFFIVQGQGQQFTRDGSFVLNQNNELTSTSGNYVQGFGVDPDGNIVPGQLGNIKIPLGGLTKAEATTQVDLQGNLNAGGELGTIGNVLLSRALTDVGANVGGDAPTGATALVNLRAADDTGVPGTAPLFTDGQTISLAAKRGGRTLPPLDLTISATTTLDEYNLFMNQALGIDPTQTTTGSPASNPGSTVTTAVTGTDPANTRRLRIESHIGQQNANSLAGTALGATAEYTETSAATGESAYTSFTTYDSLGNALRVNVVTVLQNADDTGTAWQMYAFSGDDTDAQVFDPTGASAGIRVATGTINFDNNGKPLTTTPIPVRIDRTNTGAGDPLSFGFDVSQLNAIADSSTNGSNIFGEPDGKPIGTLTSFSISTNGDITGAYDNGTRDLLGQVAIATFDNPEGLQDIGGNLYVTGGNSGTPKITAPLQLSAGSIRSSTLELSNVDLSEEFVNLIISSTGFTAASRVISTSDQLLTELLNTSR